MNTDKARSLLLSLGYASGAISNMKAGNKVKLLLKHYGLPSLQISLSKKQANILLGLFLSQKKQDKAALYDACRKYLATLYTRSFNNQKSVDVNELVICNLPSKKFYQTPEWRRLRYKVLDTYKNKCQACGRSPRDGIVIHVDHILPRSLYPERALSISNLQILCDDCNIGKSNIYTTDWR